jgi:Leucine-rich repeat (LRR) protein
VESLNFNFYYWLYLKKNQDIIDSFRKVKDLPSLLSLHKQYDVQFEDLITIPPSIGNLHHLKILKLSSNGIKIIPNFLYSLINLRELDLSKNTIEEIPHSILKLKQLKVLNLKKNNLQNIPSELDEYLASLDLFQY